MVFLGEIIYHVETDEGGAETDSSVCPAFVSERYRFR